MQTSLEKSPSTASDAELLERFAASGDDPAFAEFVRRYLPLVLAVTRRRLGNSGLAEDAAQQVFIALSRRVKTVRGIPCLAAWLQKAAVYEAANILRSETRHRRRAEQSKDIWNSTNPSAPEHRLDEALAALPDADRQVLLLHHFEKLPFEEIARRLRVTPAAAQRRGHRALGKLGELLKKRGIERSEAACTIWLGASLAPKGVKAPTDFIARTTAMKKTASFSLPWIPLVATFMAAGGVWAGVKMIQPAPAVAIPVTTPSAARERATVRKHQPRTPDDKLDGDVREFIAKAKQDPKEAWAWVKQRPHWSEFLQRASGPLADRDLAAADRFLEQVESSMGRMFIVSGIFDSRAAGSFESAITWIDSFEKAEDRKALDFSSSIYINSEHLDHDYAGALKIARSPEVRQWLVRQACEKSAAVDEDSIERMSRSLEGKERAIALGYSASVLLQRGDPRAYDLLDEVKPDSSMLPQIDKIAQRNPRGIADWAANQNDGIDRSDLVRSIWYEWGRRDATAAAEWAMSLEGERKRRIGPLYSSSPIVKRLMNQP